MATIEENRYLLFIRFLKENNIYQEYVQRYYSNDWGYNFYDFIINIGLDNLAMYGNPLNNKHNKIFWILMRVNWYDICRYGEVENADITKWKLFKKYVVNKLKLLHAL